MRWKDEMRVYRYTEVVRDVIVSQECVDDQTVGKREGVSDPLFCSSGKACSFCFQV